jgi:MATE family, multidrug efflux pump
MGDADPQPKTPAKDQNESSPMREMMIIAAPAVATMASYTIMQFFDRLMVKDIGPDPVYLAAHGNASIATWTLLTLGVGIIGIINSFVSQHLGARKPEKGAAFAWNALWFALIYWLVIMLPAAALAPTLMRAFGHEQALYELELQYAQIGMLGSIFTLNAKAVHNYFFGMHRPRVVMISAIIGNLTNIFFNALLIFGAAGPPEYWPLSDTIRSVATTLHMPQMGIAGAAVALVIGTAVEFLIPFVVFLGPRYAREFGTRHPWRFNRKVMRDILRVGWPAGFMFLNELACWAYLMSFLVGAAAERAARVAGASIEEINHAGTMATSAGFAALQWMHLSFMPAVGLSIATQALVGKAIGAGDPDGAAARAWLGLRIAMAYMGFCALVFVLFRRDLIAMFINPATPEADTATILAIGVQIMIAAAVFQVFDAIAITLSAALRGAGDTIWPGVAQIVLAWVLIVGLGHLLIEVAPTLGALGPWIGAAAYIIALGIILLWRFYGGKWRTMRLTHTDTLHNLPPDEIAPGPGI